MRVRAKMFVSGKTLQRHIRPDGSEGQAANINMAGVYRSPDASKGDEPGKNAEVENRLFGDATPSASLHMYVVNEAAHEQLKSGRHYYVTIEECPEEMQPKPAV